MWFISVEVEQDTSAPPPKKNPGSAPGYRAFISGMTDFAHLNYYILLRDKHLIAKSAQNVTH